MPETPEQSTGWQRRDFLAGAALFALAVGIPVAGVTLSDLDERDAPTERQRLMMRLVSQAVLPATDTPGAGDVGVGDFVIVALAHGLEGTREPVGSAEMPWTFPEYQRPDGSLRYVNWLEATLDRSANGDFIRQDTDARTRTLAKLDSEAFAEGGDAHPWRKLKALILTGYYTSRVGGSEELRFELVPGRYDPVVPLEPGSRAWSSDWTGVEFG
ncbi:gluconate 2-dehydrogenase subunit 3 family protein [Aurantiacibacter zhengii]|uniref:Gluconate 2-dehydrogenase subunit 3 family protein n=1 Tax=Aurantiacibacter zhengii TaxID=2307003 RepID=A0A418NUB5_9SPHN|nr:gluconate 2-dehydrogenase subunit 3 family protein [Aurantiacibacter zhengii]RIV87742.1 gluconate 2-dehydrogenase subunit 3 family protein [Aurantiacibacter zhengii]